MSPRSGLALMVALPLALAACGDGGGTGACGPILREDLDPASGAHVLPNAGEVEYSTDPPTSGPHQPGPDVDRVLDEPLPRPIQVGVLEAGEVLIQYRELSADEQAELEAVAGDEVVVAPGLDLPERIVATAWTAKRTCDAVDAEALIEFADERPTAPGSDG